MTELRKKLSIELIAQIIEEVGKEELEKIIEAGYQLTAYESAGCFNYDNYLINQFNENYELRDSDYMEYASEVLYDDIYTNNDLSINGLFSDSWEAVRACYFGDYHFNDKYVKLDGYGNLKSFNSLNEELDKNKVINYCIENMAYDEITFLQDNQKLIEEVARELVKQGY